MIKNVRQMTEAMMRRRQNKKLDVMQKAGCSNSAGCRQNLHIRTTKNLNNNYNCTTGPN